VPDICDKLYLEMSESSPSSLPRAVGPRVSSVEVAPHVVKLMFA